MSLPRPVRAPRRLPVQGALALALIALTLFVQACAASAEQTAEAAAPPADTTAFAPTAAPAPEAASETASGAESEAGAPVAFTDADLAAYERGIAREAELVRAARERARAAQTPAERGAAIQGEWEDATIPGGAEAAGMPVARYRQVRAAVHRVLQTLDFQGKIDGPQEIDAAHAAPELRRRLAGDPFAELAPASAAALRARLDRVARAYVAYVSLTAVAG